MNIFLTRFCKIYDSVILSQSICWRRVGCGGGYARTLKKEKINKDSSLINISKTFLNPISSLTIFPNPATSNSTLNIQFPQFKPTAHGPQPTAYTLKLLSVNSNTIYTKQSNSLTDFNSLTLDHRWVPGLYFLQLYENGQLLASGKVVIQ